MWMQTHAYTVAVDALSSDGKEPQAVILHVAFTVFRAAVPSTTTDVCRQVRPGPCCMSLPAYHGVTLADARCLWLMGDGLTPAWPADALCLWLMGGGFIATCCLPHSSSSALAPHLPRALPVMHTRCRPLQAPFVYEAHCDVGGKDTAVTCAITYQVSFGLCDSDRACLMCASERLRSWLIMAAVKRDGVNAFTPWICIFLSLCVRLLSVSVSSPPPSCISSPARDRRSSSARQQRSTL